jgi:putative ABC transport system permease protein
MISEIRYVIRSLFRRKGFALVTILTLALGIGSATAIYSVVDWVLFRRVPSPDGLYMIETANKTGPIMPVILRDLYRGYKAKAGAFTEFGASSWQSGYVVVDHVPTVPGVQTISINLFPMLGVTPAIGRGFLKGEDVEGRNQAIIVTYGFAKSSLGGPSAAIGKKVIIDQQECVVVGILKEGQRLPPYVENPVFRPLVLHEEDPDPWVYLSTFVLVKPGITRKQAEDSLSGVKIDLPSQVQPFVSGTKPSLTTIGEMSKIYRPELYWMLVGAVVFLFAIACLNASNLMMLHMAGKRLETSIRMALGGGRWGIVRLLLIETLGLCAAGSLLGALFANWLIPLFNGAANLDSGSTWASWNLGWKIYLVLGGLSAFMAAAIALVPGFHALRSDISGGLKNGGGSLGESPKLARIRGFFVVLQATFAVVLLVGAGLMIRTFQRLEEVKLGFDPSHRVKMSVNFPRDYASHPNQQAATLKRIRDGLQKVPGVSSVAFSSESLLAEYENVMLDLQAADGSILKIHGVYVSPEYQQAGGIILKRGRWIRPESKVEVVINEALAKKRFGTADPVGQYLHPTEVMDGHKDWLIVGVVGDVRDSLREQPGAKVYLPAEWMPSMVTNFVVDLSTEPTAEISKNLRQAIFQTDPKVVTYMSAPILDRLKMQLRNEHLALSVLRVLACIAILLTVVGLFSVLAYSVESRMPEFGVRMALGATPSKLIALVMRRGMALTGLGIAIGVAGALALTRFLQSLLFETQPYDPVVMAGVVGLLLLSALSACALPAWRASKPDVARLLKGD